VATHTPTGLNGNGQTSSEQEHKTQISGPIMRRLAPCGARVEATISEGRPVLAAGRERATVTSRSWTHVVAENAEAACSLSSSRLSPAYSVGFAEQLRGAVSILIGCASRDR
jgi:hypothetical protein